MPPGLRHLFEGGGPDVPVVFSYPAWLLLVPPLFVLAWFIARRSLSGGAGSGHMARILIRCGVFALLCIALADPQIRWRADSVAVVAVLDVSDSIPHDQRRAAEQFLEASLLQRPEKDQFGLVTVAREPLVQSLPSASAPRVDVGTTGVADATDLGSGVNLARALVPSNAAGRVLLISDGNQTSGHVAAAAAAFAASGVPIDVASVEYDRSGLVRVEDVAVPSWVREGETITARIVMNAGRAASGRLTLLLNGEMLDLDPASPQLSARVDLPQGLEVLSLPIRLPPGPVHRVEAVFEPDDARAALPQLSRAEGVTFTNTRGRVLVLAENQTAAAPLVEAISSESVRVEVLTASSAPHTLEAWAGYDAVVLFDQPAANLTQSQQQALVRYVHDTGGGLLVVGGPESFGAGGWIGSPLADALPLLLDPPQKRQMPMGALALIIDRSGSMGSPVAGTTLIQQQIANEAAILGIRALSRLDQVTVVAFNEISEVIVPLRRVGQPESIAQRVRSIGPGGGTHLFPALDAAAVQLAGSPAEAKHIIILTDGQTMGDAGAGFDRAAELRLRGITISAVAIGDVSNDPLLARLAEIGGGRFYAVSSAGAAAVLPQIFIKEARTVRRSLIREGPPFEPSVDFPGESLRGISAPLPGMTGYVVTAERGGLATVALRGPQGDPILAQWQHGLGRVTAYTSDATTRWNAAWTGWPSFEAFWSQQVRWVMRPSGDAQARVLVDSRRDPARVVLELFDPAGERVNFASIRARMAPPAGSTNERTEARDVIFRQVAPGRYEAEVSAAEVGSHLLSIRYETPAGEGALGAGHTGTVRAAIIRRSGEEVRRSTPDTALLWDLARATNGRIYRLDPRGANLWTRDDLVMPEISRPIWLLVALAAIALFLGDVAYRRIAFSPDRIVARLAALLGRSPEVATASAATLAAAKARAAVSITRAQERSAAGEAPSRLSAPGSAQATASPSAQTVPASAKPVSPAARAVPASAKPVSPAARPSSSAETPPAPAPPPAPPAERAGAKEPSAEGDIMARLRAAKRRSSGPDQDSA